MREHLVLVGGGGHCRSCIDVIEAQGRYRIAGIVDIKEKVGEKVLGYEIIGCDDDLAHLMREYRTVFITVGHIRNPARRIELFVCLKGLNAIFPAIISPTAHVSRHASVGEGTIVMHGATVNTSARIGANCIINSHALIEHDAVIDSHCHISTGAIVNGGCTVHEGSFVGSGSILVQGIEVAGSSLIGAGAVVCKPIYSAGVYAGVPAALIDG